MKKVIITVMKIAKYQDLIDKYENPISHTCDMTIGKEFLIFYADIRLWII